MDRIPCACPLQTGTIDLMKASGSYWPYAHTDPEKMAKLASAAYKVAGIESVRVPFDVAVDASAFGALTTHRTVIRQPSILKRPITGPKDLEDMGIPDPHSAGRAPVVIKAVEILSKENSKVPTICGIVSPFMLATQLRGEQEALMDLLMRSKLMLKILKLTTQWGRAFAEAAIEAGADVITLIDGMSTGDVLNPELYEKFALPYQAELIKAIHKGGVPAVLHVCGDTTRNLDLMVQTGANGLSIDQLVDIGWAKKKLRDRAAVIGNINPGSTLLFGTPDEVDLETRKCIVAGTNVMSPGCGFAVETPIENMKAMVKATKKFGKTEARR